MVDHVDALRKSINMVKNVLQTAKHTVDKNQWCSSYCGTYYVDQNETRDNQTALQIAGHTANPNKTHPYITHHTVDPIQVVLHIEEHTTVPDQPIPLYCRVVCHFNAVGKQIGKIKTE